MGTFNQPPRPPMAPPGQQPTRPMTPTGAFSQPPRPPMIPGQQPTRPMTPTGAFSQPPRPPMPGQQPGAGFGQPRPPMIPGQQQQTGFGQPTRPMIPGQQQPGAGFGPQQNQQGPRPAQGGFGPQPAQGGFGPKPSTGFNNQSSETQENSLVSEQAINYGDNQYIKDIKTLEQFYEDNKLTPILAKRYENFEISSWNPPKIVLPRDEIFSRLKYYDDLKKYEKLNEIQLIEIQKKVNDLIKHLNYIDDYEHYQKYGNDILSYNDNYLDNNRTIHWYQRDAAIKTDSGFSDHLDVAIPKEKWWMLGLSDASNLSEDVFVNHIGVPGNENDLLTHPMFSSLKIVGSNSDLPTDKILVDFPETAAEVPVAKVDAGSLADGKKKNKKHWWSSSKKEEPKKEEPKKMETNNQQQNQPQPTNFGGGFPQRQNPQAPTPGGFGNRQSPQAPSPTPGGFGNRQNPQAPTPGGFGNKNNQTQGFFGYQR